MDDKRDYEDIDYEEVNEYLITDDEDGLNGGDDFKAEDTIRQEYINQEEPKSKRSFKGSLISYIALALVASVIGGFIATYVGPSLFADLGITTASRQYQGENVSIVTSDDINTVSAVVKKAMPTVVGITTIETQQSIFGNMNREGLGSGVIVGSDGYILTNSHVIANGKANKITVLFDNGETAPANILWNDASLDLAMIKVEMVNLPVADLGDSDELEVGEIAVAIGNPLGLEFQRTVTSGIISGLNRSIQTNQSNFVENLIQTDASINSGNSGGPLLNKNGEVIGINTAKIQSAEGLGFAIPINSAKMIIEEVIQKGTFETVVLGVRVLDITEYQSRLGIDLGIKEGVIVLEVGEDTTARKSGIMVGDIIKKIDNEEIKVSSSLKKTLFKYKSGDKATITLLRNNVEEKVEVQF